VVSSLRGYFRWRASLGNRTHALVGALAYPANWQLASLPKSLEPAEVEQLEAALGQSGPSMLGADAMVRCALDLGLRSGEVARLNLDDIDWDAGTITLRRTKGRREDVMPLPEATGRAIAAYLRDERPKTQHRMVFARHMTPRERPIGPDLVRKTIRQACARRTAAHALAPAASHDGQPTARRRLLAQGGGRRAAAPLAEHNADLRQARQRPPHRSRLAVARNLRCRGRETVMTIGLTALVERYLTERRTLGFQLRSTAYSLRSLAEYVRCTRHRGPLTLEVMAQWASGHPCKRRSPNLGQTPEALALLRALDAAVRAGHRSARRHDLRAAA
jgi:hypothetical protein